jgi:predicted PilT family ATPase
MLEYRARDRVTGAIVLSATNCTEATFVAALVELYGEGWVYGTIEHPARFSIETVPVVETGSGEPN